MDVKLQNAYVEVLLDNFMSVIKQNIMLQAQIKIHDDSNAELMNFKSGYEELNKKLKEYEIRLSEIGNINNALTVDNTNKQNQVNGLSSLQSEKDRLQGAVNDYLKQMKQLGVDKSVLEDSLSSLRSELKNKNEYITQLEEIAPVTKLKKIKAPDVMINSGGTF
jgi:predicted  nucleic acid-binding Zn-ribbon protein